jgi:hypothetical protein
VGSGFLDTYPAAATLSVNSGWLFQLCVLGFRGDEDGNVGVGVFPQRKKRGEQSPLARSSIVQEILALVV